MAGSGVVVAVNTKRHLRTLIPYPTSADVLPYRHLFFVCILYWYHLDLELFLRNCKVPIQVTSSINSCYILLILQSIFIHPVPITIHTFILFLIIISLIMMRTTIIVLLTAFCILLHCANSNSFSCHRFLSFCHSVRSKYLGRI